MIVRFSWGALALSLVLGGCASAPQQRLTFENQAKATAQTLNSGGRMPSAQERVHFDHAQLHFSVDPAHQRIDGVATLTFTAQASTDVLLLDLDRNLPISAITINGQPLDTSAWSNPDGRLHIALPQALAKGERVSTTIRYGGHPHIAKKAPWDGGFVWSHTESGQPWVASAVQGEGCDLFWPCIDQPEGEPDLVDTWVTVPKGLVAPGNGVFIGTRTAADGRSTWHWRIKQPDTYAVTINVGPFEHLHGSYASHYGNTIPLDYWYLPGEEKQAKELFASFTPMLDFFERTIGPYPFGDEKMGVVETPHKGMEHQTINAYGNDYALNGYGFDDLLQHEFAHEWFGNQMTNANWDDMWLHEGFGTYLQPLYSQWIGGDMDYFAWLHRLRLQIRNHHPVVSGTPRTEEQVYSETEGPGQDIYNKGALMLHSLRALIGDKAFFDSIRLLVYGRADPEPGNFKPRYASSDEYVRIVDRVSGRKLDWFFNVYLHDAALPKLQQTHTGDTLALHWITARDEPFPMPVEVQVGDTVHTLAMADGRGTITVPADARLIVDPHSKLLRQRDYIPVFQQWMKAQRKKRSAEKGGG